jgi:hypothetical protein
MNLNTLTKAEYIKLALAAKKHDIEERWIPRTKGLFSYNTCETCDLHGYRWCPLTPEPSDPCCCLEYRAWWKASSESKEFDSLEVLEAAEKVLARIQAINILEWADELERRGVFKVEGTST